MIREVKKNKKQYWDLLFLADEQESMIEKYLDKGRMFVLEEDGCVKAECVVTKEEGVAEIKNIAVKPQCQRQGYARKLVEYVEKEYGKECEILRVGTGDSPLTIPFYKKCGFSEAYRVKNFFTDHYDHPIFEEEVQLVDMVYLEKKYVIVQHIIAERRYKRCQRKRNWRCFFQEQDTIRTSRFYFTVGK